MTEQKFETEEIQKLKRKLEIAEIEIEDLEKQISNLEKENFKYEYKIKEEYQKEIQEKTEKAEIIGIRKAGIVSGVTIAVLVNLLIILKYDWPAAESIATLIFMIAFFSFISVFSFVIGVAITALIANKIEPSQDGFKTKHYALSIILVIIITAIFTLFVGTENEKTYTEEEVETIYQEAYEEGKAETSKIFDSTKGYIDYLEAMSCLAYQEEDIIKYLKENKGITLTEEDLYYLELIRGTYEGEIMGQIQY